MYCYRIFHSQTSFMAENEGDYPVIICLMLFHSKAQCRREIEQYKWLLALKDAHDDAIIHAHTSVTDWDLLSGGKGNNREWPTPFVHAQSIVDKSIACHDFKFTQTFLNESAGSVGLLIFIRLKASFLIIILERAEVMGTGREEEEKRWSCDTWPCLKQGRQFNWDIYFPRTV